MADLNRSAKVMYPRRFTSDLKAMHAAGVSLEESLAQLRSKGASIIECIVAVKEEAGCDLGEAKRVVHQSKTWRDVAEATEVMWDELIAELKKEEPNQHLRATEQGQSDKSGGGAKVSGER